LDWWARHLNSEILNCDLQTKLDIAHDYARAGFHAEAIELLFHSKSASADLPDQSCGALPLVLYTLGWLSQKQGDSDNALRFFKQASALPPDYCFPARLEEIEILEAAMRANPRDARAPYYLGNLLYDRRRHGGAIQLWERSVQLDATLSIVWRNLGIGYFNIRRQPARARAAYERALGANPTDARLLYERDQLAKRLKESPEKRLQRLARHPDLVQLRDDLSVELCELYNQTCQYEKAAHLLSSRRFQPWEGGEGGPLRQHVRAHLMQGRLALARKEYQSAVNLFSRALSAPPNLSESKHLLANQSDIHYWLGCALAGSGDAAPAKQHWLAAATFKGDFQEMSVRAFGEMTYYSVLAWQKLGKKAKAEKLCRDLLAYARTLGKTPAKIDYFATSLPAMLLFDDDPQFRQETTALFLQAQALLGLGKEAEARSLLKSVLRRDPSHALAADLAARRDPMRS
jgi:tetratricopeptide (TPR) repeat protein